MTEKQHTKIVLSKDVTPEILDLCEEIEEGWFSNAARIDWEDFFDRRLDGARLGDGTYIDLGDEYDTPAQRKIQAHIRKFRAS